MLQQSQSGITVKIVPLAGELHETRDQTKDMGRRGEEKEERTKQHLNCNWDGKWKCNEASGTWHVAGGKWQVAVNEQELTKFATFSTVATVLQIVGNSSRCSSPLFPTSLYHRAANWGSCTDVLWAALPISPATKYLIFCTGKGEGGTFVHFVLAICPIVSNIAHTPHVSMQLQIILLHCDSLTLLLCQCCLISWSGSHRICVSIRKTVKLASAILMYGISWNLCDGCRTSSVCHIRT